MRKILALVLGLVSAFLLIACEKSVSNDTPQKENSVENIVAVNSSRYEVKPVEEMDDNQYELKTAFRDNQYNYYMYYLGRIERVPLQEAIGGTAEYTGGEYTRKLTTSITTKETIETCTINATEECTSWSDTKEFGGEFTIGKKDKCALTIKAGYSSTWGGSQKVSWEDSFAKAEEYSKTESVEITVNFNDNYKLGFYRYILMGDIDVFATIIYDTIEKEYYSENICSVATQYYTLDYSPTSVFSSTTLDLLTFTPPPLEELTTPEINYGISIYLMDGNIEYNKIDSIHNCDVILPIPEKEGYQFAGWYDENGNKYEESIKVEALDIILNANWERATVEYINEEKRVIYDDGFYGLKQQVFDKLDLSKLSLYFSEEYTFTFSFEVTISEQNDGYQQIFLYQLMQECDFGSLGRYEEIASHQKAEELGLIGEKELTHNAGAVSTTPHTYSFEFGCSGKLCKESMYIRYDAAGKDEDNWYCHNIKVTVSVKEKE
ncbi:MAG: hypothetical protein E7357_05775 [Clostridiales bacterium]|nr:hypothetical protein [Clostridiales bacterium]